MVDTEEYIGYWREYVVLGKLHTGSSVTRRSGYLLSKGKSWDAKALPTFFFPQILMYPLHKGANEAEDKMKTW